MKKCRRYRQDWLAFLRGELDPARQQVRSEHLKNCSRCQQELEDIRKLIGQTDDLKKRA